MPTVASAARPYAGPRSLIAVGKFDNRSSFMRGIFSDGVDRLGSQAKTILISHMQQSNRFNVLDRDNLNEMKQEAGFKQQNQNIRGADFIVTGDVTEFGRKEVGQAGHAQSRRRRFLQGDIGIGGKHHALRRHTACSQMLAGDSASVLSGISQSISSSGWPGLSSGYASAPSVAKSMLHNCMPIRSGGGLTEGRRTTSASCFSMSSRWFETWVSKVNELP